MRNRNYLDNDPLQRLIDRVKGDGVWCDTNVKDKQAHFFVSRNPKATIAISLCGVVIAPFERLHENTVTVKCLICDLYHAGRKEVEEKILQKHDATLERLTQTQTQTQE